MRRMLMVAAAVGALGALVTFEAGAMPLSPVEQGFGVSDLMLVRDGCGRGMRFSERRQRCVPDVEREIAVCPRGFSWSDGRQRCVPEVRVQEGCPPGYRFSDSRQACVPRF